MFFVVCKQKTAYEMRISDWSSDVCSSDLFRNPADGGSIMPTIAAHVRLLPRGYSTLSRRSTDGTVFVVVEGCGRAEVGDKSLALAPRDIFVVPSWSELRLEADDELVLFGFSDRADRKSVV